MSSSQNVRNKRIWWIIGVSIILLICYTQLTFFVIQPIGALPKGKTLIILRLNKTKFIDSPDAMCKRLQGGVNLLCRVIMLAAVLEKSTILLRVPYNELLYLISTGGKEYGTKTVEEDK